MVIYLSKLTTIAECIFLPLSAAKCPREGLEEMEECHIDMPDHSLCEADQHLPDGNPNFEINNCNDNGGDGNYDVFVCVKGGTKVKYKV